MHFVSAHTHALPGRGNPFTVIMVHDTQKKKTILNSGQVLPRTTQLPVRRIKSHTTISVGITPTAGRQTRHPKGLTRSTHALVFCKPKPIKISCHIYPENSCRQQQPRYSVRLSLTRRRSEPTPFTPRIFLHRQNNLLVDVRGTDCRY